MSGDAGVGLAEAIRSLRAELSLAMQHGTGEDIRFRVGPVELEFLLEVTQEAGAEGGVRPENRKQKAVVAVFCAIRNQNTSSIITSMTFVPVGPVMIASPRPCQNV